MHRVARALDDPVLDVRAAVAEAGVAIAPTSGSAPRISVGTVTRSSRCAWCQGAFSSRIRFIASGRAWWLASAFVRTVSGSQSGLSARTCSSDAGLRASSTMSSRI